MLQNLPGAMADSGFDVGEKFFRRPGRGVVRGEQNPPGLHERQRGGHEFCKILFRAEHAVFLRLRKRWRIQHHRVEPAAFSRQPPQPAERVAVNEIVPCGSSPSTVKIAPAPFEVFLREVEARCPGACPRRADRKAHRCRQNVFRISGLGVRGPGLSSGKSRGRCGRSKTGGGCHAGPKINRRNNLR